MKCRIEVSARHIHLTKEDFKTLFSKEELTKVKDLTQNDFSCKEVIACIGPKGKIENVRMLGPFRDYSQLEISRTDSINLGLDVPLKLSGNLPGGNIKIVGPSGEIKKEIAIVAKRHMHLSPTQAKKLNLSDGDNVSFEITGERALTFNEITVRVNDIYDQSVHVDTDEGNSANLETLSEGELII